MQKFTLTSENQSNQDAATRAGNILQAGGIIVYPTDTLYGFGANALDVPAIEKIYALKRRLPEKPLSIAVRDMAMAERYAIIGPRETYFLQQIWPGPITVILPRRSSLPEVLTAGRPVGIRCIPHPFLGALFKEIDFPVVTTSANISGEETPRDPKEIAAIFRNEKIRPDLLIDAGMLPPSAASTVIDLSGKEPKILRTGPMSPEKLFSLLQRFQTP